MPTTATSRKAGGCATGGGSAGCCVRCAKGGRRHATCAVGAGGLLGMSGRLWKVWVACDEIVEDMGRVHRRW